MTSGHRSNLSRASNSDSIRQEKQTLVSVQALRVVASLSVVATHYDQLGIWIRGGGLRDPVPLDPLAAGVDLFFVISGFIMVYSSEGLFGQPWAWAKFLGRRLARIVPMYWIATAISIPAMSPVYDWLSLLCSFLFFPHRAASGQIVPVLGVGWTLNFEMFFYTLFAVALLLPKRLVVPSVCGALCLIVALGKWLSPQAAPLLYWSDPIILEFLLGAVLAAIYRRGFVLPAILRIAFIVAGALAIWFLSGNRMPPSGYRFILWGIPSAMIFMGAVLGKNANFGILTTPITILGHASYSLYLLHSIVGALILNNWNPYLNSYPIPNVLMIGAVVAIGAAITAYFAIEKPFVLANARITRPNAPTPSLSAPQTVPDTVDVRRQHA